MRAVCDNREDVLQYDGVVRLVEALGGRVMLGHVLQHLVENAQTGVSHVAHGVLEGPDDGVQHQLELCRGYAEECFEAVGVDRL